MKTSIKIFFTMAIASMGFTGDLYAQSNHGDQEIPLIQRELFFDNPEISSGQLSPDGSMVSFLRAYDGIMNLWVKAFDEPFEKARPLTNSKEPIGGYFWTYDGKYLLYVSDQGGDENTQIYAVDPRAQAPAGAEVPASVSLTNKEKVKTYIYSVSRKNPDILWIGLNDRDPSWHDLYELKISTGELKLLEKNTDRLSAWIFDWDEKIRLAMRSPEDGTTEILRKNDDGSYEKIYDCGMLEFCAPIGFSPDNKQVYIETNRGEKVDLTKIIAMDLKSGKITDLEKDPLNLVDVGSVSFSDLDHKIQFITYTDAKTRVYFKDQELKKHYEYIKSKFPGQEVSWVSSTRDESRYLISVWSDATLPRVHYYDTRTQELVFQYTPRPKLLPYEPYFSSMTPISYKSSDGLEIPAYLTMPKGMGEKNLPLIVLPHGGPWARDYWGFSGMIQWLANRGYAVLQMNFRGSTGYGKKFINAGNKQWGLLMQDDITWGVKHLIEKGVADPKRVAIMGGSYGGYATLAGMAFTPDVYAAGVSIVGPSNLLTLLESIPPYWEAGRKIFTERMGDPSTPEGEAFLKKQSPLFSAQSIKSPLLIIQGANDPRVKKAESDQIVIALRDLGRQVEYICAPDEGHGFSKPVNNMAAFGRAEVFLGKILGARYQESMEPEVAQRLAEITVDPADVVLTPTLEIDAMTAWPAPTKDLSAGELRYKVSLEVQGQQITMDMHRTISKENGQWLVEDKISGPMGEQTDLMRYDAQSLRPLSRVASAGGQQIEYQYEPGKFSTTMFGKTQSKDIDGAYTSDGAGSDLILGRLPLKDGYKAGIYIARQDGNASLHSFSVTGTETVGGVLCFVCELAPVSDPQQKMTYFIDQEKRIAQKIIAPVPQLGATMTVEIQP